MHLKLLKSFSTEIRSCIPEVALAVLGSQSRNRLQDLGISALMLPEVPRVPPQCEAQCGHIGCIDLERTLLAISLSTLFLGIPSMEFDCFTLPNIEISLLQPQDLFADYSPPVQIPFMGMCYLVLFYHCTSDTLKSLIFQVLIFYSCLNHF